MCQRGQDRPATTLHGVAGPIVMAGMLPIRRSVYLMLREDWITGADGRRHIRLEQNEVSRK